MPIATMVPLLPQVRAFDPTYLEEAADHWSASAETWDGAYSEVFRQVQRPGGSEWAGAGADAAVEAVGRDKLQVVGAVDELHAVASAARSGAAELASARQGVLDAVAEAEAAGFTVSDTHQVASRQPVPAALHAAVQAQAQVFAAEIQARVTSLVAVDEAVAARIVSSAAGLSDIVFPDSTPMTGSTGEEQPIIQAVNYGPMPATPAPDPSLPGDPAGTGSGTTAGEIRGVIDKLPQGNKPWIREVRTPQDLENLWKWARQNGIDVPNAYGDPSKGSAVTLPDGTRIGQRLAAGSNGQPVLDVKFPDESNAKIHINPRGGVPEIPAARPAVEPPRLPAPIEPPPVRGGGAPGGFFGGAPSGDFLPQVIEPRHAGDPDLPVVGDGKPDNPQF